MQFTCACSRISVKRSQLEKFDFDSIRFASLHVFAEQHNKPQAALRNDNQTLRIQAFASNTRSRLDRSAATVDSATQRTRVVRTTEARTAQTTLARSEARMH